MTVEPSDDEPTVPWLAIALVMVMFGGGVALMLNLADPPPQPTEPQIVRHEAVDVGSWALFPDLGSDAGSNADTREE